MSWSNSKIFTIPILYDDLIKGSVHMNKKYMLDGKELDPSVKEITVKVKVPIGTAKDFVTTGRNYIDDSTQIMRDYVAETIRSRLKVVEVKPRYTEKDITVGLVYEFYDNKRNRYRVAAIKANSDDVVTCRLKSNNAGPAGDLLFSTKTDVLNYLNEDKAYIVTRYTPNNDSAMALP
jgi:hypothetical protein